MTYTRHDELTATQKRSIEYINTKLEVLCTTAICFSDKIRIVKGFNERAAEHNYDYNYIEGYQDINGAANLFKMIYTSVMEDILDTIVDNDLEYWFVKKGDDKEDDRN